MKVEKKSLAVRHACCRKSKCAWNRPAFEFVKVTNDRCVASDGAVLIEILNDGKPDAVESKVMKLSAEAARAVRKVIDNGDCAEVTEAEGMLSIRSGDGREALAPAASSDAGDFPDYEQLFPMFPEVLFRVDPDVLGRIVKAAKEAGVDKLVFRRDKQNPDRRVEVRSGDKKVRMRAVFREMKD